MWCVWVGARAREILCPPDMYTFQYRLLRSNTHTIKELHFFFNFKRVSIATGKGKRLILLTESYFPIFKSSSSKSPLFHYGYAETISLKLCRNIQKYIVMVIYNTQLTKIKSGVQMEVWSLNTRGRPGFESISGKQKINVQPDFHPNGCLLGKSRLRVILDLMSKVIVACGP